jgi:predicted ATP-grasp superfamily ATP-dependent carboligase
MNIFHRTHFNTAPVLFAAWTGAGNVGVLAIDYLRRKLKSHLFAQIDMSQIITPDSIVVNSGVTRFPETPQSVFYHNHNPDLVLFESNAHAGGNHDIEVMRTILELSKELNISRIYTAAALPQSTSHVTQPKLLYACNNAGLKGELESLGLQAMPDGEISGLNGLLLGFAGIKKIDAVCLLATIPAYAVALTYPLAALSIVQKIAEITGVSIDYKELEQEIEIVDPMFGEIEDKIKDFFSSGAFGDESEEGEFTTEPVAQDDVPKYVMDKIEKLFQLAIKDHGKAGELKNELDKWGLYKLYENRFLDLFE